MIEIVLGPPGTGKTTELLRLVDEELARGVPPDRIGYVSFTRRAASEAVERACKKFKLERKGLPYFRTLHSLCFQRLGYRSNEVLDGPRLDEFADHAGITISGRWSEDGTMNGFDEGDRALYIENLARVRMVPLRKQYVQVEDPGVTWEQVLRTSKMLNQFKEQRCYVDYTDMLSEFIRQDSAPRLEVLFVDEAQDLSALQWAVVDKLREHCRRVVVAGDDDQAIYRWAGADADRLVNLEGDARVLGKSWRVPRAVQDVALGIISGVKRRREKAWEPREADGQVERAYSLYDVDYGGDDVLVLARNGFVLSPIQHELKRRGIVYERNGHSSVKTRFLEAATTWERLRKGQPATAVEVKKVYELMGAGRGYARGHKLLPGIPDDKSVNIDELKRNHGLLTDEPWHEALTKIPEDDVEYMKAARRHGVRLSDKPSVRVQTIHTAKGGEAKHVILMTEIGRRTDRECEVRPDDERRVWYVGITRAMERLTIVEAQGDPERLRTYQCPWL